MGQLSTLLVNGLGGHEAQVFADGAAHVRLDAAVGHATGYEWYDGDLPSFPGLEATTASLADYVNQLRTAGGLNG